MGCGSSNGAAVDKHDAVDTPQDAVDKQDVSPPTLQVVIMIIIYILELR